LMAAGRLLVTCPQRFADGAQELAEVIAKDFVMHPFGARLLFHGAHAPELDQGIGITLEQFADFSVRLCANKSGFWDHVGIIGSNGKRRASIASDVLVSAMRWDSSSKIGVRTVHLRRVAE